MTRNLIRAVALAVACLVAYPLAAQRSVPTFDSADFVKCFEVLAPFASSITPIANAPEATIRSMRQFQSEADGRRRAIEQAVANIQGDFALVSDFSRLSEQERQYLLGAYLHLAELQRQLDGVMAELKCWSIMIYVLRERLPPFEPGPFVRLPVPPPPPPRRPPTAEELEVRGRLEALRARIDAKMLEVATLRREVDRRHKAVESELSRRGGTGDVVGGMSIFVGGFGGLLVPLGRPGLGATQELDRHVGFAGGLQIGAEWRIAGPWALRGSLEGGYNHTGLRELVNIGGASVPISGHYDSLYCLVAGDVVYRPLPDLAVYGGGGIGIARNGLLLRNRAGTTVIDDSRAGLAYRARVGFEAKLSSLPMWLGPSISYFGTTGGDIRTIGGASLRVGEKRELMILLNARIIIR